MIKVFLVRPEAGIGHQYGGGVHRVVIALNVCNCVLENPGEGVEILCGCHNEFVERER